MASTGTKDRLLNELQLLQLFGYADAVSPLNWANLDFLRGTKVSKSYQFGK